jgi:hypothetical protein
MAFAPAMMIAGTAIQGISAFTQGMYQSAVAKNNAKIAEENAQRNSYASQIEQMRSDREYDAQEGALLAAQSASGLDVLGHSQVMSRANLARVRGEQAHDIRMQSYYDVRNFQQEQANFLGEARAAKANAFMTAAATAFDIGAQASKPGALGKRKSSSLVSSGSATYSTSYPRGSLYGTMR